MEAKQRISEPITRTARAITFRRTNSANHSADLPLLTPVVQRIPC
jgi:hypothetical protein